MREETQHAAFRIDQVVGRIDRMQLPARPQLLHEHVVEPDLSGCAARHHQMDHKRALLLLRRDGDRVFHRCPAAHLVGAGRTLDIAQPSAVRVIEFDDDPGVTAFDRFDADGSAETVGTARLQRQRTADQRIVVRVGAFVAERRAAVDSGIGGHPDRPAVDVLPAVGAGREFAVGQHESGAAVSLAAQVAPAVGFGRNGRDSRQHHQKEHEMFHRINLFPAGLFVVKIAVPLLRTAEILLLVGHQRLPRHIPALPSSSPAFTETPLCRAAIGYQLLASRPGMWNAPSLHEPGWKNSPLYWSLIVPGGVSAK